MGKFSDYFRDKIKQVDGNGSGIDSDLLDGKTSSEFATSNLSNVDNDTILDKIKEVDGPDSGLNADTLDGKQVSELADVDLSNVEDTDLLNKLKNVDGSGSGLDADKVRGRDVIAYENENRLRASTMTEVQFRALQNQRREKYAGSGFVEWGDNYTGKKVSDGIETQNIGKGQTNPNYFTIGGQNIVNVNGNFLKVLYTNSSYDGRSVIEFTKPTTSLFTVKDSTSLNGDMKQGDFAILKDLDREFIEDGDFDDGIDGWDSGQCDIDYDSDNKRMTIHTTDEYAKVWNESFENFNVIRGIEYCISFDVTTDDGDITDIRIVEYINTNGGDGNVTRKINGSKVELYYVPIKSGYPNMKFFIKHHNDKHYTIDNISIKQIKEQPIVALQDVDKDIDIYESISKFEVRDSISKQDLVFLESWEEKVTEKDIVYPYGNTQYRSSNVDGLSGIADGSFDGADTYSLFGNWQNTGELVGRGYKWSDLPIGDRIKFVSNPENNVYLSKNGEYIQVRYRVRVVKGLGNEWDNPLDFTINDFSARYQVLRYLKPKYYKTNIPYDLETPYDTLGYITKSEELGRYYSTSSTTDTGYTPIVLVQRPNDGIFHKICNPMGTAYLINGDGDDIVPFEEFALDNTHITSLEDCFDISKIAYKDSDGNYVAGNDSSAEIRTGLIASKVSANESGRYADEINEMDVEDLRMSAHKKPLEEIHNIEKMKVTVGERRGKEKINDFNSITLKCTTGTVDGECKFYGQMETNIKAIGLSSKYVHVYNLTKKERVDFKSLYTTSTAKGLALTQATVNTGDKCVFFIIGDETEKSEIVRQVFNYIIKTSTYIFNNTYIQTDIIGDPRKLQDRIEYAVTDEDETINITKNKYIKCEDTTNNGGEEGHLYRYLGDEITGVHTNSTNGDANASDGHIDFSDTDKWLDLGDDLTIGGYKDEWLEKGFSGTPLLVGEEGESLLPVNISIDDERTPVKLSKKVSGINKVYVQNKNLGFTEFIHNDYGHSKNTWGLSTVTNEIKVNISDSYSDSGYDSAQEMLDLMKVVVIYKTQTNTMELADNSEVLGISNNAKITQDKLNYLVQPLINRVGTNSYSNSCILGNISGYRIYHDKINDYGNGIIHEFNNNLSLTNSSPTVKFFEYLTQENNRLYLTYVFKELKYDGSWGDDNKFQITNKVSTTTDTNGNTVLFGQKRVPLPYFYNEN